MIDAKNQIIHFTDTPCNDNIFAAGAIEEKGRSSGGREAKRVIWLNPAQAHSWDKEDGIMSRYAPFCHRVFECRNIKQLEKVVRDVFN